MKQTFLTLIAVFSISILNAQANNIKTDFFSFKCECKEIENRFNPKNKTSSYTYIDKDGKSGYMIGVSKTDWGKESQESFLEAIKNSNTFNYRDSYFLKYKAIIADTKLNGQYVKHIGFFTENKSFTIIVFGSLSSSVSKLYSTLKNTFKSTEL